MYLNSDSR